MYFCGAWRLRHGAPLDAGREAGAAAAAQARLHDLLDDGVRRQAASARSPVPCSRHARDNLASERGSTTPQRAKVSRVCRLSQGMSSVGPSRSLCAPSARMAASSASASPAPPVHRRPGRPASRPRPSARANRARANRCARCRPRHCAAQPQRSIRGRHLVGADRQRRGVERNEQPQRHCCASARSASSRGSSSRPTTRPSSMADGASAHRPRQ